MKMAEWRRRYWYQGLVLLELVLSAIMIVVGHAVGSDYLRGIAVGLVISWVTGALAYFILRATR